MDANHRVLGRDSGPWEGARRCLVLAPHPDDFDVVAVTMRRLQQAGTELVLEVLTSGASGVEDCFASSWEEKTLAREEEQRASCLLFGLAEERLGFHRLGEDGEGHMRADDANLRCVRKILDQQDADVVVLPHGSDSNADHRRTFRIFDSWARERERPTLALLVRDPKTLGMRLDLVTLFDEAEAEWKGAMLRCHSSQQERNLRSRGTGLDHRILEVNKAIASELPEQCEYAEGFELASYSGLESK